MANKNPYADNKYWLCKLQRIIFQIYIPSTASDALASLQEELTQKCLEIKIFSNLRTAMTRR